MESAYQAQNGKGADKAPSENDGHRFGVNNYAHSKAGRATPVVALLVSSVGATKS